LIPPLFRPRKRHQRYLSFPEAKPPTIFVIPRSEATEEPAFLATVNESDELQQRRSSDKIAGAFGKVLAELIQIAR
jgi:hypothetical protein